MGGPGADEEDHGEKGHPQNLAAPVTPPPPSYSPPPKTGASNSKFYWGTTLGSGGECSKEEQARPFQGGSWSLWVPLVSGKFQLKCRSLPQRRGPLTP